MLKTDEKAVESVKAALPEIMMIEEAELRAKVERIWAYALRESRWASIEDACFEPAIGSSLVEHVRVTAVSALHMAETIMKIQRIELDRDAVLAGALLHDVSKLLEYEPDDEPGKARMSELGKKVQHAVYGAHLMFEEQLPIDLLHTVVSHTPQSNIRPVTLEAMLVQYVDHADARIIFGASHRFEIKYPALKK